VALRPQRRIADRRGAERIELRREMAVAAIDCARLTAATAMWDGSSLFPIGVSSSAGGVQR